MKVIYDPDLPQNAVGSPKPPVVQSVRITVVDIVDGEVTVEVERGNAWEVKARHDLRRGSTLYVYLGEVKE
jgi:hypothetical protein